MKVVSGQDLAWDKQEQKPGIALLCDPQGTIREVLYDTLGVSESKLVGKPLTQLINRGSLDKLLNFLVELRKYNATFDWEMNVQVRDKILPLHFVGILKGEQMLVVGAQACEDILALNEDMLLMENEEVNALRMAIKDKSAFIAEHVRRDADIYDEVSRLNNELVALQRELAKKNFELERLNKGFDEAQRLAVVGSWNWDLKKNRMTCSDEFYRILGLAPRKYFTYKEYLELVDPDDRVEIDRRVKAALSGDVAYNSEHRIIRPNGDKRTIHALGHVVFDEQGGPVRFTGTIQDVSERKRAEEAQARLAAIVESSNDAIIGKSLDGVITSWNRGAEQLYGYTQAEAVGQPITLIVPEDRYDEERNILEQIRGGRRVEHYETVRVSKDGRIIPSSITVSPIFDPAGHITGASTIARDISDRKQAEEALSDAKSRAELYLDLMGHDINNMHQIALGYLELARDLMPHKDDQAEFLDKPIEVLQRCAMLIQNVRKLQKLQDSLFQTQDIDVCGLLVDVQREFGSVPHKTITLNLNGCEGCHVHANELLHDVFANLVSNAIKHTGNRADIEIILDVFSDEGDKYCRVRVDDNGPGIPDDFKPKIFNRLLKGDSKVKGMGLGLYLVKSLVDSYGGHVWVENRVAGDHSKGARFVVMLPAINTDT